METNEDLYKVFEEKIRPHVIVNEESGCWEWTRSLREGYGQFHPDGLFGKNIAVHRFSYETFNGVLTSSDVVRHTCHLRRCCNPAHLLKGTHKDNWDDSSEMHKANHKKLASKTGWWLHDVMYPTCRIMNKLTGLPMSTIVKHTGNGGVFNTETYRKNCAKQGRYPKV